jgi:hypothetical protein
VRYLDHLVTKQKEELGHVKPASIALDSNNRDDLIISAIFAVLSDPQTLTHVLAKIPEDGKRADLTPRVVGGLLHMLRRGVLDLSGDDRADLLREPLLEYCGDDQDLQKAVVLLLHDINKDWRVFRDFRVAFAVYGMSGRGFLIQT